jgi:hypothetical protein
LGSTPPRVGCTPQAIASAIPSQAAPAGSRPGVFPLLLCPPAVIVCDGGRGGERMREMSCYLLLLSSSPSHSSSCSPPPPPPHLPRPPPLPLTSHLRHGPKLIQQFRCVWGKKGPIFGICPLPLSLSLSLSLSLLRSCYAVSALRPSLVMCVLGCPCDVLFLFLFHSSEVVVLSRQCVPLSSCAYWGARVM